MKSFRQFISEGADPDVSWRQFLKRVKKKAGLGEADDLPKGEFERLKKLFGDQYKKPTTKKGSGISDIEGTDELGPEKRGGSSIKDRDKNKRFFDQEKLDQRKLAAQERTRFKKTTKAERAKHIGKPTHISKKHGVKYIPPKDVPKSELTGPNTKGEIVSRRRAKRSTKPDKIVDVKKRIDSIDAFNRRHKKAEYSTSTQAKNRYGGKSVQDSRGRWVPDPVEDGKPIKDGKSANRRKPSKTVDQIKKEIEARTTKGKGSTFRKPPDPWNTFGSKKPYRPFGTGLGDTSYFKPTEPNIYGPKRVIKQSEVSQRAKDFTAKVNKERIKKIHKVSVAGPTTSPTGSSYTPKTPPKIEPVIRGSSGPKFDKSYDKRAPDSSNPLKKKTKTFKDIATDSRKKLSSKGFIGRSKEYVKNLTNKIRNTFTKSKTKVTTTPQSTPKTRGTSKITTGGGKEIRSKLNQISKKPKTKFKLGSTAKTTGAISGFLAYQGEREAGSSHRRSASSGILQGLASAGGYQVVSKLAKSGLKYAPVPGWVKNVGELGAGLVGSTAAQDKMKQAYDYVFPSKNKKTNTTKNNKKLLVPPIIPKKKSKPVDLSNTTLSLTGYDPSLDKNKKNKNKK